MHFFEVDQRVAIWICPRYLLIGFRFKITFLFWECIWTLDNHYTKTFLDLNHHFGIFPKGGKIRSHMGLAWSHQSQGEGPKGQRGLDFHRTIEAVEAATWIFWSSSLSNHPWWRLSSWWFQPIWKICSSIWIISPTFGMKTKQIFELPPPALYVWTIAENLTF